jgi:hypothetical protein
MLVEHEDTTMFGRVLITNINQLLPSNYTSFRSAEAADKIRVLLLLVIRVHAALLSSPESDGEQSPSG